MSNPESCRVLVCGGRNYRNRKKVLEVLTDLWHERRPLVIMEGGARGADEFARDWCALEFSDVEHLPSFEADWKRYGLAAGFIRNREMLLQGKPDLVVAFPGGSGTRDMVKQAKQAGIEVLYGDA